MEIVYNEDELRDYMNRAVKVTPDHPVLIDHYMQGTEAVSYTHLDSTWYCFWFDFMYLSICSI